MLSISSFSSPPSLSSSPELSWGPWRSGTPQAVRGNRSGGFPELPPSLPFCSPPLETRACQLPTPRLGAAAPRPRASPGFRDFPRHRGREGYAQRPRGLPDQKPRRARQRRRQQRTKRRRRRRKQGRPRARRRLLRARPTRAHSLPPLSRHSPSSGTRRGRPLQPQRARRKQEEAMSWRLGASLQRRTRGPPPRLCCLVLLRYRRRRQRRQPPKRSPQSPPRRSQKKGKRRKKRQP